MVPEKHLEANQAVGLEKIHLIFARFQANLSRQVKDEFKKCTLENLHETIRDVSTSHSARGTVASLSKIRPFVDAMTQLVQALEIITDTSDLAGLIYGATRYEIIAASSLRDALHLLIEKYVEFGNALPSLRILLETEKGASAFIPLVERYASHVMSFHGIFYPLFARPVWKQLFSAVWTITSPKFSTLLGDVELTRRLLKTEQWTRTTQEIRDLRQMTENNLAALVRVLDGKHSREDDAQLVMEEEARQKRFNFIVQRLRVPDYDQDQFMCSEHWKGTDSGSWLLGDQRVRTWKDAKSDTSVLYMSGIPGAGKSVLSSIMIDHLSRSYDGSSTPVAYFYFKHDDETKRTLKSMLSALLVQLIYSDEVAVRHVFDSLSSAKGMITAATEASVRGLTRLALRNQALSYVVLDGLNESPEAEKVIGFFEDFLKPEQYDDAKSCSVKVMFSGQRDGKIDNLLRAMEGIREIRLDDCSEHVSDIRTYTLTMATKIREQFSLVPEHAKDIAEKVTCQSNGMFLYATAVMQHLLDQVSEAQLRAELEKDQLLPMSAMEQAYGHIVSRVLGTSPRPRVSAARNVLGWLCCAARPLFWREVQTRVCVDIHTAQSNPLKRYLLPCEEICGSLVDTVWLGDSVNSRVDPAIMIVHESARAYLLGSYRISLVEEHAAMAIFCGRYMLSPPFCRNVTEDVRRRTALTGYYGFVEYALAFWADHTAAVSSSPEISATLLEAVQETAMDVIRETSIGQGLDGHSAPAKIALESVAKLFADRAKQDLSSSIQDSVEGIRYVINTVRLDEKSEENWKILDTFYGPLRHKCPRTACRRFHFGFVDFKDLGRHLHFHELDFSCPHDSCPDHGTDFLNEHGLANHLTARHGDFSQVGTWRGHELDSHESIGTAIEAIAIKEEEDTMKRSLSRSIAKSGQFSGDDYALSQKAGQVESVVDEIDAVLGTLDDSHGPDSEPVDNGVPQSTIICTELMLVQRRAVSFMMQRETSEFCIYIQNNLFDLASMKPTTETSDPVMGGILGDEMGLGKTLTTISLIANTLPAAGESRNKLSPEMDHLAPTTASSATLVVVPHPLILESWLSEIKKHTEPGRLSVRIFHGPQRTRDAESLLDIDIVLTTYSTLVQDFKRARILSTIDWFRVVLDEAHCVVNQDTKQFRACEMLRTSRRWCLTGTPIQRSVEDIGSLIKFLRIPPFADPRVFGKVVSAPLRSGDRNRCEPLRLLLQALCLRRCLVSLSLPRSVSVSVRVELSAKERGLYKDIVDQFRRRLEGKPVPTPSSQLMLTTILRLRQICNLGTLENFDANKARGPTCATCTDEDGVGSLLFEARDHCPDCWRPLHIGPNQVSEMVGTPPTERSLQRAPTADISSKLLRVAENITQMPVGEKCIVFSCWSLPLHRLGEILVQRGIIAGIVDGEVPASARCQLIERFQCDGALNVLLMTMGSSAVGLSMTAATSVHLLEPQWNPMVEEQAISRVARLGQTRQVTVVRYIVAKSIEENVVYQQRWKKSMARNIPELIAQEKLEGLKLLLGPNVDSESLKLKQFESFRELVHELHMRCSRWQCFTANCHWELPAFLETCQEDLQLDNEVLLTSVNPMIATGENERHQSGRLFRAITWAELLKSEFIEKQDLVRFLSALINHVAEQADFLKSDTSLFEYYFIEGDESHRIASRCTWGSIELGFRDKVPEQLLISIVQGVELLCKSFRKEPVAEETCLSTAIWKLVHCNKTPDESSSGISTSSPHCDAIPTVSLEMALSHHLLEVPQANCWQALFSTRYTAVDLGGQSRGPPDDNTLHGTATGKGLEIPFQLMTALAAIEFPVDVNGGVVLVGYETLLVPVEIQGDIAQFHLFTADTNGKRKGVLNPHLMELGPRVMTSDFQQFFNKRCFLGWCDLAHIQLGTRSLPAAIGYSGGQEKGQSLQLTGINITSQFGLSGPFAALGGAEGSFKTRCHRVHFTPPAGFHALLVNTADEIAAIYDASQRRCWVVPKLSLLLHMCRAYCMRVGRSDNGSDGIPYVDGHTDANELIPSLKELGDRSVLVGESDGLLLRQLLLGFNINLLDTVPKLRRSESKSLYGFEFMDVVSSPGRGSLMKALELKSPAKTWIDIVNGVDALVVCSGIGAVIVAVRDSKENSQGRSKPRNNTCCNSVPEGRDYLTATVACLARVVHRNGSQLCNGVVRETLVTISSVESTGRMDSMETMQNAESMRSEEGMEMNSESRGSKQKRLKISADASWDVEGDPFSPCIHHGGDVRNCWYRADLVQRVVRDSNPLRGLTRKRRRDQAFTAGIPIEAMKGAIVFGKQLQ